MSQGDLKSVQGDMGHASAEMVYDLHAHMMDEDRIQISRTIFTDFYQDSSNQKSSNVGTQNNLTTVQIGEQQNGEENAGTEEEGEFWQTCLAS